MNEASAEVAVIGGGLAAISAIRALRESGHEGAVVLYSEEDDLPYDRPPLSKGYLTGAVSASALALVEPSWYEEQRVTVRLGAVVTSLADGRGRLGGGEEFGWSRLLVTTGGAPRQLGAPALWAGAGVGLGAERITALRTRRDADRLRGLLAPGRHLLIVGGGLIGGEVAAHARLGGVEVTMLEALPAVFARSLGPWLAARVEALHRDHGVRLYAGVRIQRLEEGPSGVRAQAADGRVFEADAALVGLGLVPAVGLLEHAGAQIDDGVLVDATGRTSLPGVYAAGDVARRRTQSATLAASGERGVRSEHWQAAMQNGSATGEAIAADLAGVPAASSTLANTPANPPEAPWFWTDQYGRNFQVSGDPTVGERAVIRGSDGPDFLCFLLDAGGAVRAAVACDRARELRLAQQLVRRRAVIDPHVLADDTQDLRRLARSGS